METRLIHSVIFAKDYDKLVNWYIRIFDLEVKLLVTKDYHYTDLAQGGKLVLGLCPSEEVETTETPFPRKNGLAVNFSVSDIEELFKRIPGSGGKVLAGPSVDKNEGFKFGGLEDPEGNLIWIIENFDFS